MSPVSGTLPMLKVLLQRCSLRQGLELSTARESEATINSRRKNAELI